MVKWICLASDSKFVLAIGIWMVNKHVKGVKGILISEVFGHEIPISENWWNF